MTRKEGPSIAKVATERHHETGTSDWELESN